LPEDIFSKDKDIHQRLWCWVNIEEAA